MRILIIMLLGLALMSTAAGNRQAEADEPQTEPLGGSELPIKVTIATVSPIWEGQTSSYHLGQEIPLEIKLTNTSSHPVYSCLSDDLYQDLPQLRRNGQLVPYTDWQSYMLKWAEKNQTCLMYGLSDRTLLLPNTPTTVDSLIVVDSPSDPVGALAWYDELSPGKYELSVKRRLSCCDGPLVESNTIEFEITP